MSTTLPKTKVRVTRKSQSLNNPNEGLYTTRKVIYEGFLFLEDISNNSDFDKYFLNGLQEAKRFYGVWKTGLDIQTDDYVEFNLDQLGAGRRSTFDPKNASVYKIQLKVPIKQSALAILGSRHQEGFFESLN